MEYVGKLLKYYPQFSLEFINYELNMDLGWALIGYATEQDSWLQFAGIKRISKGPIAQEVDKLEKQYYDVHKK